MLAIASEPLQLGIAADLVAIGEVGLTGEVRRVGAVPRRLAEAARLGFRYALVPPALVRQRPARSRRACGCGKSPTLVEALHWAARASASARCDAHATHADRHRGSRSCDPGRHRRKPRAAEVSTLSQWRPTVTSGKAAGVVVPGAGVAGVSPSGDPLRANLALMAPGTALRDGLERILRGRTGALIVLGYDEVVESVCTGGFRLDVEFSATHLRELCKMDGAIILSSEGTRILRANVHLMPDPKIPTAESGTRHRTAERVAKQTGYPVISVSQSMHIICLYLNGQRHVLDDSAAIMSRANQALATLERYKLRLDEVSGTLSALEIEDLVTLRDAVTVVQRLEMVRRIADEIAGYVVELGTDGRLLALQLDELMAGVETDRTLVVRDYLPDEPAGRGRCAQAGRRPARTWTCSPPTTSSTWSPWPRRWGTRGPPTPWTPTSARAASGCWRRCPGCRPDGGPPGGALRQPAAAARGHRRGPSGRGGIGDVRARTVREGLSRLAEASILERYV